MRKVFLPLLILLLSIIGFSYWVLADAGAHLAANKSVTEKLDDFVLHIRIENADNGIQVFRSIQYLGNEPIEIQHTTPLVAVSLFKKNLDFTGSPASKVLKKGYNYHPQEAVDIQVDDTGSYKLYCKAKFIADGKEMVIDHVEKLIFK